MSDSENKTGTETAVHGVVMRLVQWFLCALVMLIVFGPLLIPIVILMWIGEVLS